MIIKKEQNYCNILYFNFMGNKNYYNVKAASLNFSSICISPFQYYQTGSSKQFLMNMYKEVLFQETGKYSVQWDVGKIDMKFQKERYAVIYRSDICIVNEQLLTRTQFMTQWQKQYQKNIGHVFKNELPLKQHKQQIKLFDWLMYRTFCLVAYNKKIDEIDKDFQDIKGLNSKVFRKFLVNWHNKKYLNQQLKIKDIQEFLAKGYCDVLLLQQAKLKKGLSWKKLVSDNFSVEEREGTQSVIIFKKNKFPEDFSKDQFYKLYKDKLNFNQDTIFVKCKSILLISAHLSSKKQNNYQIDQMFNQLNEIRKKYPNLELIGGIHSQSFLDYRNYINPKYQFAPFDIEKPTTLKKRTSLQLQTHKAFLEDKSVKSHIITNCKVNLSFVGKINGEKFSQHDFLPKQQHPFDHFLVGGEIQNIEKSRTLDVIRIASLNFSGICLSPFEFYDQNDEKKQLSRLFETIVKSYFADPKFEWKVGKIDQKLQIQRYTPIYRKNVCIINNLLMNRQQFNQNWDSQFEQNKHVFGKNIPSNEEIQQAKMFDWISYETIVNFIYNREQGLLDMENIKNLDSKYFSEFMRKWHSKKYLSVQKKMKQVVKIINDYDVFFLQQAKVKQKISWRVYIPYAFQFQQNESTQSIIIYRKEKFQADPNKNNFQFQFGQRIKFNNDTTYLKTKKYLFLSSHLTSKSHNKQQVKQMIKVFDEIKTNYPNLEIIVGQDANHFINPNFYPKFYIKPVNQEIPTNKKKRTAIQVQTRKANTLAENVKDSFISTLYLRNFKIQTIGKNKINANTFLPSDEHPFDHFLISAEVEVNTDGIRVASLNFSGICLSPFEYYDTSEQLQNISELFSLAMKNDRLTNIENFSWNVGRIDQRLQKQRYTPIYRSDVCVKNNKLITKKQFIQEWNIAFDIAKAKLKEEPTLDQINHARTFDWLAYITLLNYLYNENYKFELMEQKNISNFDSKIFQKKLKQWHSRSYLDINKKMKLIKQYVQKLDVFFLQQTTDKNVNISWRDLIQYDIMEIQEKNQIKKTKINTDFRIVTRQNSQSMIILRNSKFEIDQQESQQFYNAWNKKINFNNDTVFIKTKNYLLISAHLTSKETNIKQVKQLFEVLNQIRTQYDELEFIVGCDANHFIHLQKNSYSLVRKKSQVNRDLSFVNSQIPNNFGFMITPSDQLMPTNIKTRTNMQLQTRKSNICVANVKDHIISTLKIVQESVNLIDDSEITNQISLPTNNHPFDHFLVRANLARISK